MDKDFSEKLGKLWNELGTHAVMTLSTCSDGIVSARPMSVVVINGRFYCQTDISYKKCSQIKDNPNSALCFKNYSVEGTAELLGRPTEYDFFMKAMKKHFRPAYLRYSSLDTECVIEITPKLIYCWKYELGKPYMEYWDFENSQYRKEQK